MLAQIRERARAQRTAEERLADGITSFAGSNAPFDPFPFGLLTMIVSLEAIFLATFVMVSQKRMGVEADRRAKLDLQLGILTEYELTRVLRMLDATQDKLGIDNAGDSELADLERVVQPEALLEELHRVQGIEN